MELILIIAYAILFMITSLFFFFCFKRIRSETLEYDKARRLLDDIIFSFNKDLQRQEEKILEISRSHQENATERERAIKEINDVIANIRIKLEDLIGYKESITSEYKILKEKIDEMTTRYNELLVKVNEIEKLKPREEKFRETEKHERIETTTLSRESRALSSLTETELKVLEILAREGEKTAPEIRDKIKLTREHTARLLKSLYLRGYVERIDDKIPYVYRLNKEMEEILRNERLRTNP
ncbi:MAG: helix-turn-helix domain-containing protein [Candidatus Jordarchaeaceae archaeon]